jgi:hypothetical protein
MNSNKTNFPNIIDHNRNNDLFEPFFSNKNDFTKSSLNLNLMEPDWTPNFSENIDIEQNSVNLALNILNMSKSSYNSMTIQELKSKRIIDCSSTTINALNILIYYKQNSKSFLPKISPIQQKKNNWTDSFTDSFSDCDEKFITINNDYPKDYKK